MNESVGWDKFTKWDTKKTTVCEEKTILVQGLGTQYWKQEGRILQY